MSTDTLVFFRQADLFSSGMLHFGKLLSDQTPPKIRELVADFIASFARETLSIKQGVFGNAAGRVYEHLIEPFTNEK